MDNLAAQIMRRKSALASKRQPHESVWRECFDYSFPERGDGFDGEKNDATALQAKRAKLLDSTSTDASQILASATISGCVPSNSRWFGLSAGDDTDEERTWFDDSSKTIWENIHGSNFDSVAPECVLDMTAAGWFVMLIDVDREVGGYHFEQWPLATCWIAASKPGGLPDTLVRCYELTAEQAANEFGLENLSEATQKLIADNKQDTKVEFVHSIYPRPMYVVGSVRAKNLPFASCHIEAKAKKTVRESGYHECPFVAPRWAKLANSDYAVGPMFRALPDVKQLNRLVYLEDTNADMAISGMWIAEDDGVLNPRTVRVGPRKIIVANSVDSMKPLQSGANFELSFTKKEQLQASIRKILMADQLAPQDGPVRTAFEINVRVQMIRQLLGPIYGRMQAEWLQPMVARCFGLAMRAGILKPMPPSLADKTARVVFTSPMAKAQKLEEVTAVESSLVAVGQVAAAKGDISVWDTIDVDESVRIIVDGRGAPAKITRSAEDVQAIRDARSKAQQQQMQQQQQAELLQKTAPVMVKNAA